MDGNSQICPPLVSVCMPVYNASKFLRECMDSVLSQTFGDFEFVIVDDGSTDDSVSIVESYADSRIRLIRNRHDYIGSLNILLREARGKYIARMDADDVMMPYRLKAQTGYMEKHTEVGVLGGGMQQIGEQHSTLIPLHKVTMQDMINSCCIAHPSVMMRTSVLKQYGLCYEEDFKYAEDYRFWMQLMKNGIVIHNLSVPIIKYRISGNQITSRHSAEQFDKSNKIKEDGAKWLLGKIKEVSYETSSIPKSTNLLTIVIPFLNEREEVGNTVRSIRNTAGNKVDIVVVDDHSDDNYDYRADLAYFNVTYIYNDCRIGAAASKEKGVRLACTPYFLLLDAHMRCFTSGWHNVIVAELQKNDRQILCCQTKALHKDEKQIVSEKGVMPTYGAYILFDYNNYIPGIHWNDSGYQGKLTGNRIACILGAGYAASKKYWSYIKGLEGLMHYGSEEAYLSLKAWLEGGGCSLLPEVFFGHIYRATPPYRIITSQMHYNHFVISATLFPTSLQCWANAIAYKKNRHVYKNIRFWLSMNNDSLSKLREYYQRIFQADFENILDINDITDAGRAVMAVHEKKRMQQLLNFLVKCSGTSCVDLWEGCMGLLIVLCEYEKYACSDEYTSLRYKLLERVLSQITPQSEFSVSFAHGICGIGWGIIYLIRNIFTDMDFSKELAEIDRKVMERDPQRIDDFSFQSGIGGILCYVTNRLFVLQEKHLEPIFHIQYLECLKNVAKTALEKSDDFRTHSYALLFLEYGQKGWYVLRPKWKDVIDLPNFLPKDLGKWNNGLTETTGYMCNLIQTLYGTMQGKRY